MAVLPPIYSPVTKYFAKWGGLENGKCGEFYMDFMRCSSRVGIQRAIHYDCVKELADFHECMNETKQVERYRIISKERKKQKRPYIEPLPEDIIRSFAGKPPYKP
ncbi:hypothetical protein BsWGS_19752 [Bradybaena similaris]